MAEDVMVGIRGLRKVYPFGRGEVVALDGVDLEVRRGEFVAIVGPSGSGKSTLMNMIGCLDTPSDGTYVLDGEDVSHMSEDELAAVRNRKVGFVFQVFNLMPRQIARDNVELPLLYGRASDSKEKARQALARVGLADREDHRPSQLSGGQCQRVAIARALANQPAIVLADEPTGALDSRTGREIMELFSVLNRAGVTLIVVTHAPEVAAYARTVYHLHDGKITKVEQQENPLCDQVGESVLEQETLLPSRHHGAAYGRAMLFVRLVLLALANLIQNKLRSFLTMLGMIIGVGAVIIMMSLGEGTRLAVRETIQGMGTNLLVVVPWWSKRGHVRQVSVVSLREEDAVEIVKASRYVVAAAPERRGWVQIKYFNVNYRTKVVGTTPDYPAVRKFEVERGTFFDDSDMRNNRRVCILGAVVKRELFGAGDAIGRQVKVNGKNFRVVGIMEEKGMASWENRDDQIFIPLRTFQKRLFGGLWVSNINVQALSEKYMDEAQEDIEELLRKRHRLTEDDEPDFRIYSQREILDQLSKITNTFQYLLAGIAGVSLLVGGIGIMNIMLVSVAERTREIGIRKAIGARRRDILTQFLIESVVMSLTGGFIGIAFGYFACKGGTRVLPFDLIVTPVSIVLGFVTSTTVGLFFGIYPGYRASRLDPIVALRYE